MSFEYAKDARAIVFDDEPLESLIYGCPSSGPSRASVFLEAYPLIDEVRRAAKNEEISCAVENMTRLLESEIVVPRWACAYFISVLRTLIPTVPIPVITRDAVPVAPALRSLFEHARRYRSSGSMSSAGLLLYRWYESQADYGGARDVLHVLLDAATTERDELEIAQLTNNYAYEYLLEGQFTRAEPYFIRAQALYERLGNRHEVNNSRANLLICRFGILPADRWDELLPELRQVNRALTSRQDWRARKTLILLARRAEVRGKLHAATGWARRAVKSSGELATQHRLDDEEYLKSLEKRQREHRGKWTPASAERNRNAQEYAGNLAV